MAWNVVWETIEGIMVPALLELRFFEEVKGDKDTKEDEESRADVEASKVESKGTKGEDEDPESKVAKGTEDDGAKGEEDESHRLVGRARLLPHSPFARLMSHPTIFRDGAVCSVWCVVFIRMCRVWCVVSCVVCGVHPCVGPSERARLLSHPPLRCVQRVWLCGCIVAQRVLLARPTLWHPLQSRPVFLRHDMVILLRKKATLV